MNRKFIIIAWLLYVLNETIEAENNTRVKPNNFNTLPFYEDVSKVDIVSLNEDLNNSRLSKYKLERENKDHNASQGYSNADFATETDMKEKSRDLTKRKDIKNEWKQTKQQTDPTNLSEDPETSNEDPSTLNLEQINSSEDPGTSNEDPSTLNLEQINSSEDPGTSNEDALTSNLDQINSNEDLGTSNENPLTSNLEQINSSEDLETSRDDPSNSNFDQINSSEDPETSNKDPKLDISQELSAYHMHPNIPPPNTNYGKCLTGYMTDVQSWVDASGNLNDNIDFFNKIDVSSTMNPVTALSEKIQSDFKSIRIQVTYLSLAKCNLKTVPQIFTLETSYGMKLESMLEYITFFGNDFSSVSNPGEAFEESLNATDAIVSNHLSSMIWQGSASWAAAFTTVTLSKLKELDLRKCFIQHLPDNLFQNMPTLKALYLGENYIKSINANAFVGLSKLRHLDMSRNLLGRTNEILTIEHDQVFKWLTDLISLDLSHTVIQQRNAAIFQQLNRNLQSLSICYSGLNHLPAKAFADTQIKYLDVSGNVGILGNENLLKRLQMTLKVIYAKDVGLKTLERFKNFQKLQIINVDSNEIVAITKFTAESLKSLMVLNLDNNRFVTWWEKEIFGSMPKLKFLSLRHNNINFISNDMIEDFKNINYIGLSWNFVICNCYAREVFEIAYRNQNATTLLPVEDNNKILFHKGFEEVNQLIKERSEIKRICDKNRDYCTNNELVESEGNFTLFDFDPVLYSCLLVPDAKSIPYSNSTCLDSKSTDYYEDLIGNSKARIIFLIIFLALVFPVLAVLYIFRRNLRYFWITIKNSATLSLISSVKTFDEDTIYHYDVFVSYCNGDRNWVLDHLLPYVEKDCNVSVCLHERDFQVGLSILENIVSCMDRSRSIMLIISKQFLASQWCQFEMHLAQHRLLETRREDLILVLLEDIPRRMRPTTLHYLMLTKTYILWPQRDTERPSFWKRLTRSLIARSRLVKENVSLA